MLTADGTAKVMDFGLARAADASAVTMAGVLMGTAAYISPEQARGDATDARSDLYSLGVMLYEMIGGQLPFSAESTASLIFKHINEQPIPLRRLAPEVLPAVDGLVWARVYAETEGNPFFILAALRMWQEEGQLVYTEAGWRLIGKPEEMRVPQRVHDVVIRRLQRLDETSREILDVAAVAGRRFTVETISAALALPKVELLRRLGRLEKNHQLIAFESGTYTFAHHLIRDVLYAELAEPLRVEYHLIIAKRLEELFAGRLEEVAYDLAHHFYQGADCRTGLRYAQMATERAERQWALEEALHFNRLALDSIAHLPGDPHYIQQECKLRQRRAALLEVAGDLQRSLEELERARALSEQQGETAPKPPARESGASLSSRRFLRPSAHWWVARNSNAVAASMAAATGRARSSRSKREL